MKMGIITRDKNSWSSIQLRKALSRRNIPHIFFRFEHLVARVNDRPYISVGNIRLLEDLNALLVRPIGRGSLEEIVFRMDMLYKLERAGMYVLNPPEAIEHCADKYDILVMLEENGIPVPKTIVTENLRQALRAFHELGGDVVIKPLFGSRGVGLTRINDVEVMSTILKALNFHHNVLYIQEFVHHGCSDIRALVVGNRVIAAMRRVANGWKTNYSQGARPEPVKLETFMEETAIKAAKQTGCKIAGIDILESQRGPLVVDVNSQPGWRGLQSVVSFNIADEIVEFITSDCKG